MAPGRERAEQPAIDEDFSYQGKAWVLQRLVPIMTLVTIDLLFAFWKIRNPRLDLLMEGAPLVIVDHGKLLKDRMAKSMVDKSDVLHAAREFQGLERIDQIKYAVLERNGGITIIPG